jgi:hypothetical protein
MATRTGREATHQYSVTRPYTVQEMDEASLQLVAAQGSSDVMAKMIVAPNTRNDAKNSKKSLTMRCWFTDITA